MKTVADVIKELEEYPPDMPVYHYDGDKNFSTPEVDRAETNIEGEAYMYVMISSQNPVSQSLTDADITD